jgi:threonine dehydratase
MVIAIGGGSQAVRALTVFAALKPEAKVYGVQAVGASAAHAGWLARKPMKTDRADTFADGLATRSTYEMTFQPLLDGLADFITVTDAEIADAMRMLLRTTHTMVDPRVQRPRGLRSWRRSSRANASGLSSAARTSIH